MSSLTQSPAWLKVLHLSEAFESHRAPESFFVEGGGLTADFSRQYLDAAVQQSLIALCEQQSFSARRDAMFAGAPINTTEGRPVLHAALRSTAPILVDGVDMQTAIAAQLLRMKAFAAGVRAGKIRGISEQAFTDVVSIGIGGSSLGPQLICNALRRVADGPNLHFVSNVDGAHLQDTLQALNPATTLFLIVSKTFTTDETLTNANSAKLWIEGALGAGAFARHAVAITANPAGAKAAGYPDELILEFWNWVGGRYSMWSTVGLPIAIAAGYEHFAEFLAGAAAMDEHFRTAPLNQNLPVMLGLAGIWNRNFLGMTSHAVLPYSTRMAYLPKYLQQLEMESNGKSVDRDGKRVDYVTCPVMFGEPGTDGQHSFHQLLHQGTDRISADIVLVAAEESTLNGHHAKLLANGLAQADALWRGSPSDNPHRVHEGGRPVTLLVLPKLDAWHIGSLIALYEHKVFTQGVIWNINSFDQFGVELGKKIATSLLPAMSNPAVTAPAHLIGIVSRLRELAAK